VLQTGQNPGWETVPRRAEWGRRAGRHPLPHAPFQQRVCVPRGAQKTNLTLSVRAARYALTPNTAEEISTLGALFP